ncbi:hypothetical protein KC343_g169 [Hortaea werneckii]|nr:hypothetical protein KC365_g7157 [Hortaea werneckii]KAI7293640.1 hypothetical protein KC352_g1516 [Hortaea werneckii]KAI7299458.1 hypothetical protein KC340_g13783 [Hortaea werneckii]KAI7387692.1 hypothetical protein KC328_g9329 [Hortaea werneckii]KAI7573109.1 hypothetical protein KC317_g167 [Hortaea werneckii]
MAVATNIGGRPQGVSEEHRYGGPDKITLLACAAKDTNFGAAVGWAAGNSDKVKSYSLGKYLTMLDADLYAVHMAVHICRFSLPQTASATRCVEILSDSRQALSAIDKARYWTTPVIREIGHQIRFIQDRGDQVILSQRPSDESVERMEAVRAAAKLAATQQPKAMRSASLSYVMQSIKTRWKLVARISKVISGGRKSVTARYLQLQSGHAITGEYLLRTKQAQDARCWWCNSSKQTVSPTY